MKCFSWLEIKARFSLAAFSMFYSFVFVFLNYPPTCILIGQEGNCKKIARELASKSRAGGMTADW